MSAFIGKGKQLLPRRKRARTKDESSCSVSSSSSTISVSSAIDKNTAEASASEEKESKKRNAQLDMNYKEKLVPLYSLPDEVLNNCLSYVGNGYHGSVGLVSKKITEAYKEDFGRETAYLEMATSVNLASHCLNKLCKTLQEKDEMLKAAAVNGNVDILRAAVKDGYDLFPLIAMKKRTFTEHEYHYDNSNEEFDVYYADDDERNYSWKSQKVILSKLVERGHLHVLKYLYEELHYFLGLQRYFKPAIEYGKLEILEWLDHIGTMEDDSLCIGFLEDGKLEILHVGECAIKSGHVESFKWLIEMNYRIFDDHFDVLLEAIRSKSTEMIQYCFDIGFDILRGNDVNDAIKGTRSVEVYRKMHELGFEFGEMRKWYDKWHLGDYIEIIKFLRSISIPWDNGIMKDIVKYGTLEMIQYAHEDGCPWTGKEYSHLFSWTYKWNLDLDKFKYLIDNNCAIDYAQSSDLISGLGRKKELALLEYFVGKNSSFDNLLFQEFLGYDPWFEGISYLLAKTKDIQNFKSLDEVFQKRQKINGIKFFHSLGLPWCLDSAQNTHLLSKIACYNDLEDIKWAYENGCKGGNAVPYVKEEWEKYGIRDSSKWKANQAFLKRMAC